MVHESDINFRTLTYEVNAGIFVCDPDGKFIYANLAMADIFGFERSADIIRKNFKDFFSPERGQVFMYHFRKSLLSGKNSTLITNEIKRHDGKPAYIEVSAMPFIKNGKFLGIQGVVHDITASRHAEIKLMQAQTHDALTGIYNRNFFEAEMKRLERGRQFPISLIIVIMGGLINLGAPEDNEVDDKLIKRVAHQLFYAFRGDDIVARIGEDKFAILLPSVGARTVNQIVNRLQGQLPDSKIDASEPSVKFYFGSGTSLAGDSLNAVLRQAEALAQLHKKRAERA